MVHLIVGLIVIVIVCIAFCAIVICPPLGLIGFILLLSWGIGNLIM